MNILILIPARAGSSRIKDKNLQQIDGKSLVGHALDDADSAAYWLRMIGHHVDVCISTDYPQSAIGHIGPALYIKRPEHLSGSHADIGDAIQHAASQMPVIPDYIVTLQPTVMARCGSIIADLTARCIDNKCCGLSLTEAVPWQWGEVADGIEPMHETSPYERSQALGQRWQEINAIMVTRRDDWITGKRWSFPLVLASLPSWAAIDIDDHRDLTLARGSAQTIRRLIRENTSSVRYLSSETGEPV